jgi:hypothetical protein
VPKRDLPRHRKKIPADGNDDKNLAQDERMQGVSVDSQRQQNEQHGRETGNEYPLPGLI